MPKRLGPTALTASRFFNLEPEVAGAPAKGPGSGPAACVFDSWLGDDLVRAYPLVLVTTRAKRALLRLDRPTGFDFLRAHARTSAFYRRHNPGKRLPVFWAVRVSGRAGLDDAGLTEAGILVVSGRVLDALLGCRIPRAVITQHESASAAKVGGG